MRTPYKNARCNICDQVSHGSLDEDTEDIDATTFYRDPHSSGFLCGECYSSIADITSAWYQEEDLNEKEFDFDEE